MFDLEWSTQAVFVVTSLISAQNVSPLDGLQAFYPRPQITTLESNKSCECVSVCVVVCVCVSCLSVSASVLEKNPLLE